MACQSCDRKPELCTESTSFPDAWQLATRAGIAVAPWVPMDPSGTHVAVCVECQTRWLLGYDERERMFISADAFPTEADAVLRADGAPADVVAAALAYPATNALARAWMTCSSTPVATLVAAVAHAFVRVDDRRSASACLDWIDVLSLRGPDALRAIAADAALLATLRGLADRAWPPMAATQPSVMAQTIARIGERLQAVARREGADLRAVDEPLARRDRAMRFVDRYVEGAAEIEVLSLAGVALRDPDVVNLRPLDAHVALVLRALERSREADRKIAQPRSRNLRLLLAQWLHEGRVPTALRAQTEAELAALPVR